MYSKSLIIALASSAALVNAVPIFKRAAEFGTCSDPTIKFANGLDGRTEPSFAPNNAADFNHGSALNIGVISDFICGQIASGCKADAAGIAACAAAEKASTGKTGQAAADAFNAAITGGAAAPAAAKPKAAQSGQAAAPAPAPAAAAAADPAPAAAAASGDDQQTFIGALGGAPPPVVAGGKGFLVDGTSFINKNGALGRSCDVQHNACANAANSGGGFTASQCDAQNNACHAAI